MNDLPAPCEQCAPQGGDFRIVERDGTTYAALCKCDRGEAIKARKKECEAARAKLEPLNSMRVGEIMNDWEMWAYFPSTDSARFAIFKLIIDLCHSEAEVSWIVKEAMVLWNEWPGPREIRALYCAKFGSPKDGELITGSLSYPDGFPCQQITTEAPTMLALPPGDLDEILKLAKAKDLNAHRPIAAFHETHRPICGELPSNPNFKPITQADIDRAVEEMRQRRVQS